MSPTNDSVPTKSAVNPKPLFRILRTVLVLAAGLMTLVALFYAEENWRGRRAWLAYKRQFEAQGGSLDLKSVIPPPVPDDQNFAMTPLFKSLYDYDPGTQTRRDKSPIGEWMRPYYMLLTPWPTGKMKALEPVVSKDRQSKMDGNWRRGWSRDMVAIYLLDVLDTNNTARSLPGFDSSKVTVEQAAVGVLENLAVIDPILNELRAASRRPSSRFNVAYLVDNPELILLPHLAHLVGIARWTSYRASAELVCGQTQAALDDILLTLRLADSLRDEPLLGSQLVRANVINFAIQPTWEGIAAHRWSSGQLELLQKALIKMDLVTHFQDALLAARLFANVTIEFYRDHPERWHDLDRSMARAGLELDDDHPLRSIFKWMPRGWFFLEMLEYNRRFDAMGVSKGGRIDPRPVLKFNGNHFTPIRIDTQLSKSVLNHRLFAEILLPDLKSYQLRAATVQAAVDQASIACALERHRIARGGYPASLQDLVPAFGAALPSDVVTGEPYKYRRNPEGSFVLYSVGWDLKDGGGKLPVQQFKSEALNLERGDWVWFSSPRVEP